MKRVYKAQKSFKSKVTSSHIFAHDQAVLSVSEEQLVYVVYNIWRNKTRCNESKEIFFNFDTLFCCINYRIIIHYHPHKELYYNYTDIWLKVSTSYLVIFRSLWVSERPENYHVACWNMQPCVIILSFGWFAGIWTLCVDVSEHCS
jgi:hypothetical protein